MYQPKFQQYSFENFHLPFQGKLDPENRWSLAEEVYAQNFLSQKGAPALSVRMALGSLIIKESLGLSDLETMEQIKENPYLQYFIGLERYENDAPFDASMLTWFRKRLDASDVMTVQEKLRQMMVAKEKEQAEKLAQQKLDEKKGQKKEKEQELEVEQEVEQKQEQEQEKSEEQAGKDD